MTFASDAQRKAVMARLREAYNKAYSRTKGAGEHAYGVGKDYAYAVATTPVRAAGYAKGLGHSALEKLGTLDPNVGASHIAAVASSLVEDAVRRSLELKMMQAEDLIANQMDSYEHRLQRNLARRLQTVQSVATRRVRPLEDVTKSAMPRETVDIGALKYKKLRTAFDQQRLQRELEKSMKAFGKMGISPEHVAFVTHMTKALSEDERRKTRIKNLQDEIARLNTAGGNYNYRP